MNNLVIITGPTAVGKTEISIELAKAINGEIISADSIQVYKYMDIGSAKIKKEEMQGIKHYLSLMMNLMLMYSKSLQRNTLMKFMKKGKRLL